MSLNRSIASVRVLRDFIKSYQSAYFNVYQQHPEYMDDIIYKRIQMLPLTDTIRFGVPHDAYIHRDQYLMRQFFNRQPTVKTIIDDVEFVISGMGDMTLPRKSNNPVLDAYIMELRQSIKYRGNTYNVRPFNTYYPPNYTQYLQQYYENSRYKSNMLYNVRKLGRKDSYDSICEIIICKYSIDEMYMLKQEGITIDLTPRV
jgi:hypothetical protein